jgi:hypothetical protein
MDDYQSNPQSRDVPTELAEKHSELFLPQVLHPRGIKVISETVDAGALESLQIHLGRPDRSEVKQVLGTAFVEFDTSEVIKMFRAMGRNEDNEAMHEAEYRTHFLKRGLHGSPGAVCRCIQKKMIVDGSEQRTWIPLPVVIDRRESGIPPPTMIWDSVGEVYPDKVGESKSQDKYFIPDHLYAVNGRDEAEQSKIMSLNHLPGFLLMAQPDAMKPPYLIQESKDHHSKEREARQYLSLLTASVLHDRMLLRWLTDEAQANKMITLDRELCIYGMTCCGGLVTLYKMSIRDIWSNPVTSMVGKPVRYDFMKVESFMLTEPSHCARLSDWMNTLHFYGQTSLAESMMQDGEKAHSSKKIKLAGWKRQLSQVVFLYGKEPNTATFNTEYASTSNNYNDGNKDGGDGDDDEDNEDGKDNEGGENGEDNEDNEDGKDNEDNEDSEDSADDAHPDPKRRRLSRTPCSHICRNRRLQRGRFCKHVCCKHGREGP